jgi:hypothetical protein
MKNTSISRILIAATRTSIGNNLKSKTLTLKGVRMKTTFKRFAAALGLVLIGTILTARASAECGYYPPSHKGGAVVSPQSWNGAEFSSGSLLLVSEDSNNSIVGMWKFALTAQGNTGPARITSATPWAATTCRGMKTNEAAQAAIAA